MSAIPICSKSYFQINLTRCSYQRAFPPPDGGKHLPRVTIRLPECVTATAPETAAELLHRASAAHRASARTTGQNPICAEVLSVRSDGVGEDEGNLSRLVSAHNPGTSESRPGVPVCSVGSASRPRLDGPDGVVLADAAARQASDARHDEDCGINWHAVWSIAPQRQSASTH